MAKFSCEEDIKMKETTLTGNPDLADPGFECPPDNPLHLMQRWLDKANQLKIREPKGLVLSTISTHGIPSSRVVLLKEINDKGVIFSSTEISQKGKDLQSNPIAAGTLWWRETMQQINFQGLVKKLPPEFSDKIFKDRPLEAQAIAMTSTQSAPMLNEKNMREKISDFLDHPEKISRPASWHAYHITIESIEFWLGSKDRFHKRLRYELIENTWQNHHLQP